MMSVDFLREKCVHRGQRGWTRRIFIVSTACFLLLHKSPAAVLSIAILLSGLSTTMGAPTHSERVWWNDPCSEQPQLRHGRAVEAKNQLKYFINKINLTFFDELKNLYPHSSQNDQLRGHLGGKCLKINKMLRPIREAKNAKMATEIFYETMVQLAMFIDKLKEIPVKTPGKFNVSKRKSLLEETKDNLRLVMCEFNVTINRQIIHDDLNPSLSKNIRPKVPKISLKCLPKGLDMSSAQMTDLQFYGKLLKFFTQSKTVLLRKRRQRVGNKKRRARKNRQRIKELGY